MTISSFNYPDDATFVNMYDRNKIKELKWQVRQAIKNQTQKNIEKRIGGALKDSILERAKKAKKDEGAEEEKKEEGADPPAEEEEEEVERTGDEEEETEEERAERLEEERKEEEEQDNKDFNYAETKYL